MKKISLLLLLAFALHSPIFSVIFDSKKVPLSIRLGLLKGLQAKSIDAVTYPPITYKDLDRGLYVVPKAVEANFSTSGPWKLILHMGEQYHDDYRIPIHPEHKVLWRFSETKDAFRELKNQSDTVIKVGKTAKSDDSVLLDIAFYISWDTPSQFQYSFPFTFSLEEDDQ